ncbi:MAG TPA: hypothetical protein VMK13_07830 [Streptosporangiaceae bacterium]|nr:hypothetical protein [Streptosporangiaceae bacterium]
MRLGPYSPLKVSEMVMPTCPGHAEAMHNLGALLADSDPGHARGWWEKATAVGDTFAMTNLGWLLATS